MFAINRLLKICYILNDSVHYIVYNINVVSAA